jgi:hypothetical protein
MHDASAIVRTKLQLNVVSSLGDETYRDTRQHGDIPSTASEWAVPGDIPSEDLDRMHRGNGRYGRGRAAIGEAVG